MSTLRSTKLAPRPRFFVVFSSATLLLVLAGFTTTFFLPLARGTFSRPWFVYAHGSLFFLWASLLVAQALLAMRRRLKWHRQLGWFGAALVPAMAGSGVLVAHWATRRDIAAGEAADALPFFFGALMDMFLFASLASAAILLRGNPTAHKRLILIATLAILGAAVGRIPVLGGSSNYITVFFLLSLAAFDLSISRRFHPATIYGGLWLLVGIFTQAPIGNTSVWLSLAQRLLG
ncbi:MAG: hypothetical protein ABIS29_07355 [Vicinamibacterales bacterium]